MVSAGASPPPEEGKTLASATHKLRQRWLRPKPSTTELFFQDSILFPKVVNGELLLLVDPSGHGDEQEPEWVEDSRRLQNLLSRAWG